MLSPQYKPTTNETTLDMESIRTRVFYQNLFYFLYSEVPMSVYMAKLDTLDPEFRVKVDTVRLEAYKETGYEWVPVSCTRTMKEQHGLFIRLTDHIDNDGDGLVDEPDEKVTNADQGSSPHNFGMGCDCAPMKDGDVWWKAPKELWKIYADIAVKNGLSAGFYFKSIYDAPHIEDPAWKQRQALWRAGKLEVA